MQLFVAILYKKGHAQRCVRLPNASECVGPGQGCPKAADAARTADTRLRRGAVWGGKVFDESSSCPVFPCSASRKHALQTPSSARLLQRLQSEGPAQASPESSDDLMELAFVGFCAFCAVASECAIAVAQGLREPNTWKQLARGSTHKRRGAPNNALKLQKRTNTKPGQTSSLLVEALLRLPQHCGRLHPAQSRRLSPGHLEMQSLLCNPSLYSP